MKTVGIVQSNYIPWKGYFDLINSVDEFILYDDAQYTKRDWRNRNIIKTKNGSKWITIPVEVKGKFNQRINEVQVADLEWRATHWGAISQSYKSCRYFKAYEEVIKSVLLNGNETKLSDINFSFIKTVNEILGIKTKLTWSSSYMLSGESPSEKLLNLCLQAKGTHYLSGPLARAYMELEVFKQASIDVDFFSYENYPEYNQLYPPFDHKVSILDLIFNEGPNATDYMKSFSPSLKLAIGS